MPTRLSSVFLAVAFLSTVSGAAIKDTLEISRDNSGMPIPRFSNGFTIFQDRDAQTLTVYDATGAIRTLANYSLKDTQRVTLRDVAASSDGNLVLAATAVSTAGNQSASSLIWINTKGETIRVVRTSPFGVSRVIFSPEGTVWAFGLVRDADGKNDSAHDVLREFDSSGKQIRTALPWKSFPSGRHPAGEARLVGNRDRFGVFSESGGEYVELNWNGTIAGRWLIDAGSAGKSVLGAGLTSSGNLFVGRADRDPGGAPATIRLDRALGKFVPVAVPAEHGPRKFSGLLGVEGEDLVLYGKPTSLTRFRPD